MTKTGHRIASTTAQGWAQNPWACCQGAGARTNELDAGKRRLMIGSEEARGVADYQEPRWLGVLWNGNAAASFRAVNLPLVMISVSAVARW